MSIYFKDLTWPELQEAADRKTIVLLPIGTVEEHGKHLPVSTDEVIATQVAKEVAEAAAEEIPVLVMPTIWTGYSVKQMTRWPGTIRVEPETLIALTVDVCSSLIDSGFGRIVVVSSHGNHTGILRVVARKVADKHGVHVVLTNPAAMAAEAFSRIRKSEAGGAIHAGEYETSLMLHFGQPVDMSKATDEDHFNYHSEFVPGDNFVGGSKVYWSTWGLQESQTGAYGDATCASAETGQQLMEAIVGNYVKFLRGFWEHDEQSRVGF